MAIFMLKTLLEHEPKACPPEVGEGLATAYCERGNYYFTAHCYRKAIADYGKAIATYENLREILGERWSFDMAESLADAHTRRAEARAEVKDRVGALADYGQAIELLDSTDPDASGSSPDLRRNAAKYLANRANIRSLHNDSTGAVHDADGAIALLDEFLNSSGRADPDQLADWYGTAFVAYLTRAAVREEAGAMNDALIDHAQAINVMERLRKKLATDWDAEMKTNLREAFEERADLLEKLGRPAEARADRKRAEKLENDPKGPAAGRRA